MKRHQKSKIKRECLSHTEKAKKKILSEERHISLHISTFFFFTF